MVIRETFVLMMMGITLGISASLFATRLSAG